MPPVKKYYTLEAENVLNELEVNLSQGLSPEEASDRLKRFGVNRLPEKPPKNAIIRFIRHFNDILIYVLIASAIITFILGHYVDTAVIVMAAVVNALIGFMQENKVEKALENIKKLLPSQAAVLRGGRRIDVDAVELAPGDIVFLEPGDKVPADIRLAQTDNLQIEESSLTGESIPAEKNIYPLRPEVMLGDRINMAFSGTTVRAGTGVGVVTVTGVDTELGRINKLIEDIEPLTTPLLRQTARFGKIVSIMVIGLSVAIFFWGYFFHGNQPRDLLPAVIGLAVAAIPEGLPAILSIILAIGVQNMAKRKAIIRNLPSVETLGAVSVICSDKTGTLTQNEMTVQAVLVNCCRFDVSGTGYAPEGNFTENGQPVDIKTQPALTELLTCFNICNDAQLGQDQDGHWTVNGDPTEGALLTLYQKAFTTQEPFERLKTIPFDSEYKYMATLVKNKKGDHVVYIKGAPDRLLNMAAQEYEREDMARSWWHERIREQAMTGRRLIGGGMKIVDENFELSHESIEEGIIFIGAAAIVDPPRPEAALAVKSCIEAGIKIKMITGDHLDTAKAIARELNIGDGSNGVEGWELSEMSSEQMRQAVVKFDVFARTSPEHKLRLVEALQANGDICAMTGDGVNDAPALKKADVGIAMGIKGTEVSKNSAVMVLADDNFSTIVAAVEEGRRVYDNLRKSILFLLPTHGGQSFLFIASILFGTLLPLTPVQILWVNMVSAATISLALAFEKADPDIMKRPPRPAGEPLLSAYFIWRIFFVSILIGGLTLLMNILLFNAGYDATAARTITMQGIVFCQAFHIFNVRSIREAAWSNDFLGNKAIFVSLGILTALQLSVTYVPLMNRLFATVPLDGSDWGLALLPGVLVFIIVEVEKAFMRTFFTQRHKNCR